MTFCLLVTVFWCRLLGLAVHLLTVDAGTHWIVTEDGLIQGQMDSIYNLRRPYDLMSFLHQERSALQLDAIRPTPKKTRQQPTLQSISKSDPNCGLRLKPLAYFDVYISTALLPTDNKFNRDDYVDFFLHSDASLHSQPICSYFFKLDFSMHSYEHLVGIQDRWNLTSTSESHLKNIVLEEDISVDEFGDLLQKSLHMNKTSWIFYNMAALYWRIKGEPLEAIECLRRALHFSPSRFEKAPSLVSLANLLHRSRYSNEALILLRSALEVSPKSTIIWFMLGNVYTALGKYTESLKCYESALKLQPDNKDLISRRNAVHCHIKMETIGRRGIVDEMTTEFDSKTKEMWLQLKKKITTELANEREKESQRRFYDSFTNLESTEETGQKCIVEIRDGRRVLQCSSVHHRSKQLLNDFDFTTRNERRKEIVEVRHSSVNLENNIVSYNFPVRPPLYKKKNAQERQDLSFLQKDWPLKDECDVSVKRFPAWNEFQTTYLSPENKGFEVKALLGIAQGLFDDQQHPFPWYPPVCSTMSDIPEGERSCDHIDAVKNRVRFPITKIPDYNMKSIFLSNIEGWKEKRELKTEDDDLTTTTSAESNISPDEVGQRILTAMKQNIGPNWLLYNLAALYWRVDGNFQHGLECVRRSLFFAPDRFRDIPLVNLANILYKLGRVGDAITIMYEALTVNNDEPESHFFMGNLLAAVGNSTGAISHYQEALVLNSEHEEALKSLRVVLCYQKFYRPPPQSSSSELQGKHSPVDSDLETSSEMNIVCKQRVRAQ